MGVVHSPESEYTREMERWNTPKRFGGHGPNGYEPFPKMLYRAMENPLRNGKVMCGDPGVAVGDDKAESFTRGCQLIVQNEDERDRALKAGWCTSPDAAIAAFNRQYETVATAAAEEAYRVNRMPNERARDEFHQAQEQADGYDHVPDPAAPKKDGPRTRIKV